MLTPAASARAARARTAKLAAARSYVRERASLRRASFRRGHGCETGAQRRAARAGRERREIAGAMLRPMNDVQEPLAIVDDSRFDAHHDPGGGHPERPERLAAA